MARNLIENGLKHGASDAPVAVSLSNNGVLTVTNEGTAVPPELLERLSRPFVRGTTENCKGIGTNIKKDWRSRNGESDPAGCGRIAHRRPRCGRR
ncbi:MAG TPA: ATP-binding protein [Hyphomicrobiaceae bacterium]|nr:ATP-binding protein [Hyphomicrobiaceae bacterium]